ncbi:MAG TPA: UPF0182 family protein [Bryobacteraceae bacterium]|nr:UPF0182 family protein [Bryobacteraceae bacterium]
MGTYRFEPKAASRRRRFGLASILIAFFVLLFSARTIAAYVIDYQWWKEMGQVPTWFGLLSYSIIPLALATLLAFAVLFAAHARALKFAGVRLRDERTYAKISTLALLALAYLASTATVNTWTVVRYAGSRNLGAAASTWADPVFHQPLSFYLFDLPFLSMLRSYIVALAILSILVYWVAARVWQLRYRFSEFREMQEFDPSLLKLEGGLESRFLRGAAVVFILALAFRFFLARYEMVYNEHGAFMVGIDYVNQTFGIPLLWAVISACVIAAILVMVGRWMLAAAMALVLVVNFAVPQLVSALYVRPNEISIQRPYINTHIHATRAAFNLENRMREMEFAGRQDAPINVAEHRAIVDNVRLWDWRAFHDTISQIQALRPYYVFNDSDVDRYTIDGQYRQVLLSPRELDLARLPEARARWINPHFIYTHGYGLVMAEVARISPDGLPYLMVQDAPPEVRTPSLKITRPEIYYGEVTHEPVFVKTEQAEFDYPSGEKNVQSHYKGNGGFPVKPFATRLAAAVQQGDANILLTGMLNDNSRMMIRRRVAERIRTLAAFIDWDADPYLVVSASGHLMWIIDGYTTSSAHPYSRSVNVQGVGEVNYIRNSVKATIDAYDGSTNLYIFAPNDPIILAYRNLFPGLFKPESEMPADLRAHARYPEAMFRVQAEIYRTYHMLDPQAFYNKEDLWDFARYTPSTGVQPQPVSPTYIVASIPGQDKPEFLLLLPFTPRNKDNLIGLMLARCDGESLGEIVVLQMSKQELMFGPMQIAARTSQHQVIARDLSLWNQQGSQVLRGQILVLPVGETLMYVDPIYIQATEARMPQLKKVVLAAGNRLVYEDTYEEALAALSSGAAALARQALAAEPPAPGAPGAAAAPAAAPTAKAPTPPGTDQKLETIRQHLKRYRDFAAQGRWAEAGKELEAIEAAAR